MTDDMKSATEVASYMRGEGIRTQLYSEKKKFKARIGYADKLSIPFVIFLGEDEISSGKVSLKDMKNGEQITVSAEEAAAVIRERVLMGKTEAVIIDKE